MSELRLNTLIFISKNGYGLICERMVSSGINGSCYSLVTYTGGVNSLTMTSLVEIEA